MKTYEIRVIEDENARSGKLLGTDRRPGRALARARKFAMDYYYGVVVVDVRGDRANWGHGWDDGLQFDPESTCAPDGQIMQLLPFP